MAGWAKAPDFADRPERQAQVRAQTVVDKQRYLDDGYTPVGCRSCGIEVLVRKASSHQKSVQWTVSPTEHCPIFKALGDVPGHHDSCPNLDAAVDRAVDAGALPVGQPAE